MITHADGTTQYYSGVGVLVNGYSSLIIKNSTIYDMPYATGIKSGLAPDLEVINTTITGTTCGMYIYLATYALLQNVTITQNSGPGGWCDVGSTGISANQGNLLVRNSIIANNFPERLCCKPKDCAAELHHDRRLAGILTSFTNLEGCTCSPHASGDIIGQDPLPGRVLHARLLSAATRQPGNRCRQPGCPGQRRQRLRSTRFPGRAPPG